MEKDAKAARQYYETAANLGDTDAMGEIAWCYVEGFGGKKDKVGFRRVSLLESSARIRFFAWSKAGKALIEVS